MCAHVVLVLTAKTDDDDGREAVRLSLHFVHADVVAAAAMNAEEHAGALAALRPLLRTADALREAQRGLERCNAADARATGRGRCLNTVLHPLLYHDACTLYAGLASGEAWVSPRGWGRCAQCGNRGWGVTCTPPRVAGGRLMRDFTDDCVAFCWWCTARRSLPVGA